MSAVPFTVTVQSKAYPQTSDSFTYSIYNQLLLGSSFNDQQVFVKLVSANGLKRSKPCMVFADFVAPQYHNDKLQKLVGTSDTSGNQYLPLAGPFLHSTGTIRLVKVDGTNYDSCPDVTLVFHFATKDWIK